jgi:hypothetical protein
MTETKRINWRRLSNGTYLVRTQAGFRQAIKHKHAQAGEDFPGWSKVKVLDWPDMYPSVCRISVASTFYDGQTHVTVTAAPLDAYRRETQRLLDELEGE